MLKFKPKQVITLLILAGNLLLGGCSTPTDPTRFYTLQSSATSVPAAVDPGGVTLGITSIQIPALIDRPQIVSREGNHEIIRAEYHQWGGSVLEEIEDAIVAGLGKNLEAANLFVYPSQSRFRPDFEIALDIRRFDGEIGKNAVLEMTWQASDSRKRRPPLVGKIDIVRQIDAGDYSSYVADLNDLLFDATSQISDEIKKFAQQ